MRGNPHVRFLGEEVAARRPPYPTYDEGSTPFTRSIRTAARSGDAPATGRSLQFVTP